MKAAHANFAREARLAKSLCGDLSKAALKSLEGLVQRHKLSLADGDLKFLNSGWYVTHAGLLRLAERRRCAGMHVRPALKSSDPANSRWVFRAVVFKSRTCKGFVGYGDADPSNTSDLVRGAEMRVAETRAVNRALRKAYGIGICSVEEIGSSDRSVPIERPARKIPPESAKASGSNRHASNGNGNGTRVRDRLCQLIRQHKLDAELVKAYAVDFCSTKTLREASREQVEAFVVHLADWAEKDCNALLCQLNSFQRPQEQKIRPQEGAA